MEHSISDFPELEDTSNFEEMLTDNDNSSVRSSTFDNNTQMDDEEPEGEEDNCLDVTYIHVDDQPMNYDGVEDDHQEEVDDYASARALKRNLTETFEKHAEVAKKKSRKNLKKKDKSHHQYENKKSKGIASSQQGGVKAKIKAFEEKNVIIKPKNSSSSQSNNHKIRVDHSQFDRPPTAPVPQKLVVSGLENKNTSSEKSLLSVYLRVRPPIASEEAFVKDQSSSHNTVEVIPPKKREGNKSKSIRTYPPPQSNASKVVRGQHQLHSTSHNTDLIFNGTNKNDCGGASNEVKGVKEFNFDQVFGIHSAQEEIFDNVAVPLVDGMFPSDDTKKIVGDILVGKSALLFSYGITNAGKTYTIMGKESDETNIATNLEESHGIIPRSIDRMLSKVKGMEKKDFKYHLNLSYLEIYNENIFDLLPKEKKISDTKRLHHGPGTFPIEQSSLRVRESKSGRIYARGLAKHQITSLAQGLELVAKAKSRRRTSSNSINNDSSRSHSICQFELVAVPTLINGDNDVDGASIGTASSKGYNTDDDSSVQSKKKSKKNSVTFWIVDLAGSERSKRTGVFSRSVRQKEAALINSSLMKLMRCLQTLRHNQSTSHSVSVVPFRESKLTHLFMDHLTGKAASRTSMIVNINPSIADFDETQHVLSYATVAKSIRISESDYNRKRQAIQITGIKIGKKTKNDAGKSPPRKIAKLVKKLSPRSALARIREQQRNNKLKQKQSTESMKTGKPKNCNMKTKRLVKVRVGKNKQIDSEIEKLQKSLAESEEERKRYESEAVALRDKLVKCEADIRREIFEETEVYHKCIHEQHNEIVSRLKQQITAASKAPSMSAIKVKRDQADTMIDELMDKVDECEEEMARITESHEAEVAALKDAHFAEIAEKDEEIETLQAALEETEEKHRNEITTLNAELAKRSALIQELEKVKNEKTEENSQDGFIDNEGDALENDKENKIAPSPRLRRLPRQRCSEVACANISPPNEKVSSSTKKQRKGLTNIRSPFKQRNTRETGTRVK